jgi:gliding motility-associated-like protein
MKNIVTISFLILLLTRLSTWGQIINIHSVASLRSNGWDNGYTLDGDHMAASRAKLFNPINFSDTGVYKKGITIHSDYFTSGSLEQITGIGGIDIFFFGSFGGSVSEFTPFTQAEKDSLYAWSLRGGKMIIAEQIIPGVSSYQLGQKWGYTLMSRTTSTIIPVEKAKDTKIFNGPFGVVDAANMGGSAQAFFDVNTPFISVLGTNDAGKNTLYIDCKTRDLICADVDAYTDLGGLSLGNEILNSQDRFWVNTIVFMDSLGDAPPPAVIQYDGTNLYTDTYYSYQWLLNWDILEDADSSTIEPSTEGYYMVIVEDEIGCTDTSELFVYGTPLLPLIHCPEDVTTPTDHGANYATLTLPLPRALDPDGIASFSHDAPGQFPMGSTVVTWIVTDSAGYSSSCSHTVTVTDTEKPTIACPPTVLSGTDPGLNYATIALGTPVTNDNVFVLSVTNNAPQFFLAGTTRVLWTVSDSSGNYRTCYQTISVTDTENPEIMCPPDITAETESGGDHAIIDLGLPVTDDNDRVVSVTSNAPGEFPIGTTMVTWRAEDNAGNTATCDQVVFVTEAEHETGLSFPNIITPNGDGKNDYFVIENLPENSGLLIFDRFNKVCYRNDNYHNNWNGNDNLGNGLENGTYWFLIKTADGKEHNGYVIVKRE